MKFTAGDCDGRDLNITKYHSPVFQTHTNRILSQPGYALARKFRLPGVSQRTTCPARAGNLCNEDLRLTTKIKFR
jgi:hypothetical protein